MRERFERSTPATRQSKWRSAKSTEENPGWARKLLHRRWTGPSKVLQPSAGSTHLRRPHFDEDSSVPRLVQLAISSQIGRNSASILLLRTSFRGDVQYL